VITRLLGRKFANRGQNTKRITRQHDDIARLTIRNARDLSIRDELDRISTTRVLGDIDVVVVRHTVRRVVNDVLEDRTEADGVEDLGLFLGGKVDAFGVAPSFDVEYARVGPDVFVIADEETVRVGGEGCFAGAGETEEESDVAIVLTHVGGGMQRKLAKLDRLEVMHDGKDTLLHFTSVFRTEDDHLHTLEVNLDGCGRAHTLRESVSGELARIVDDEVRFAEFQQFRLGWADQHVVHEQSVVGTSADNSDLDAVLGIPLSAAGG